MYVRGRYMYVCVGGLQTRMYVHVHVGSHLHVYGLGSIHIGSLYMDISVGSCQVWGANQEPTI